MPHVSRYVLSLMVVVAACSRDDVRSARIGGDTTPSSAAPAAQSAGTADGRIRVVPVDSAGLSPGLAVRGSVTGGRRWTDRLGENLLVLTSYRVETGDCSEDVYCGERRTHGYHFLLRPDGRDSLLWRTTDRLEFCEGDTEFEANPATITVTDLDADGTAETTFMYLMVCRSDVSPATLKLIMHEGTAKYAIRGESRIGYPCESARAMNVDPAFAAAPAAFRAHAEAHWRRWVDERRWFPEKYERVDSARPPPTREECDASPEASRR